MKKAIIWLKLSFRFSIVIYRTEKKKEIQISHAKVQLKMFKFTIHIDFIIESKPASMGTWTFYEIISYFPRERQKWTESQWTMNGMCSLFDWWPKCTFSWFHVFVWCQRVPFMNHLITTASNYKNTFYSRHNRVSSVDPSIKL